MSMCTLRLLVMKRLVHNIMLAWHNNYHRIQGIGAREPCTSISASVNVVYIDLSLMSKLFIIVMIVVFSFIQSVSFQLSLDPVMMKYTTTSTTRPWEHVKNLYIVVVVATVTTLTQ